MHLFASRFRRHWSNHLTQRARHRLSRVRFLHARHLFRRSLRHNSAATLPAFRTEIDDPVRLFDHVQVVFDDQHGVTKLHQTLQHVEQFPHIIKVQSGGRLVENVERPARLALAKVRLASLMRCASPPESVVADWPSCT